MLFRNFNLPRELCYIDFDKFDGNEGIIKMKNTFLLFLIIFFMTSYQQVMAQQDQQQTINSSLATVERIKTSEGFGKEFDINLQKARAVLIVPAFYKAGFIFGGEYGNGVLLGRKNDGTWSYPAFYRIEGGSVGFQAGIESASIVFLVMNDNGLKALMNNQFRIGADTGITVLVVSAGINASTTSNFGADILAYELGGIGLYGGLSIEGSLVTPRDKWNEVYYNSPITASAIVKGMSVSNPAADRLREYLAR
jgi:lipid-binding SYLF domain-containing protein